MYLLPTHNSSPPCLGLKEEKRMRRGRSIPGMPILLVALPFFVVGIFDHAIQYQQYSI